MKRKTIRNHKDFYVSPDGFTVSSDCFVIKAKSAKINGDARYGLVVSKKSFKFATERNRAKRLIRDWIAANEDLMLPELDYVFILYASILSLGRDTGRTNMADALQKISKQYNKNAK